MYRVLVLCLVLLGCSTHVLSENLRSSVAAALLDTKDDFVYVGGSATTINYSIYDAHNSKGDTVDNLDGVLTTVGLVDLVGTVDGMGELRLFFESLAPVTLQRLCGETGSHVFMSMVVHAGNAEVFDELRMIGGNATVLHCDAEHLFMSLQWMTAERTRTDRLTSQVKTYSYVAA